MTTDEMRREFEEEVRRTFGTGLLAMGKKDSGEYHSERLNAFFKMYAAGRAAAVKDREDAERYRQAIAHDDNAELLYSAVINHCPDKAAIDAEFDAEAIAIDAAKGRSGT